MAGTCAPPRESTDDVNVGDGLTLGKVRDIGRASDHLDLQTVNPGETLILDRRTYVVVDDGKGYRQAVARAGETIAVLGIWTDLTGRPRGSSTLGHMNFSGDGELSCFGREPDGKLIVSSRRGYGFHFVYQDVDPVDYGVLDAQMKKHGF